ncbi:MAG: ABC transporter substrate-binding protein [Calditrichaeota bacterium]|nr:ABC transporter substrate-binding protein [Calditrichota bacterium]RQW03705.1 MAG: ABC transporter substrate-binding protein [Calditrichota bacterium]
MRIVYFTITVLAGLVMMLPAQLPLQPAESFGDRLIIGEVGEPPAYLNPFKVNSILEKQLTRLIYGTGLIQGVDRFGQPPILVDRFIQPASRDVGYIWHYSILRNIYFHSGIPMRNRDVKFTFDYLRENSGHLLNRTFDFSNVDSLSISGDLEFTFLLKEKDNFFDQDLSNIPILSEAHYRDLKDLDEGIFQDIHPMGYGPFMFESRTLKSISLVPHPNYAFGIPFLERIIYRFYDNEQEMLDDFMRGNLDLIEIKESETARRMHQVLKNQIKIFPAPRPEKKVYFILFNINGFPFDNVRVRSAIRGSINQNEIVNGLVERNSHIAYSVIDYTHPLFFRDIIEDSYEPNVSLGNLKNDGWINNSPRGILEKDGRSLSFELLFEENSHLEESIARGIKIHLAELGINVQPRPVSLQNKKRLVKGNNYQAVLQNYSYYDEDLYNVIKEFYFKVLKNKGGATNYVNPLIERLFAQGDAQPNLRKKIISRFQIFLYQNAPAIFLYFDDEIIYAVDSRFQNMRVSYSSEKVYYYRLMPFENWFVPKNLQKYPAP